MLKKICYYPPTMVKKQYRHRSKHRKNADPNMEVYQFYQQNIKPQTGSDDDGGAAAAYDLEFDGQFAENQRT